MLYGNPEVIIHNLIAKINAAPAPKSDKLDSIIEFALTVQNLCATIEACELLEYSYNVVLLRELVDKLPSSLKLDWAKHRRTLPSVNLSTFADWLYDLAETVCPIAPLSISRPAKNGPAFLNTHCEENGNRPTLANNSSVLTSSTKLCPACRGDCSGLEKCQHFLNYGYNSRWTMIKEAGICRKCLRKRKGTCKLQQSCGKNGCTYKHHPLLHNSQLDETAAPQVRDRKPDIYNQTPDERDCHAHHSTASKTRFRVVPVVLYGREKKLNIYAFLDDGSSWTLMDA
ncbi:uncharacterized protein LOC134207318 [Armigeres subalbatus]|uniref:uncharacterized protein LOC134207318 n=1 Tax=Armigeres subalbatus TaxID=124917 RepID=UPI002ED354A5